MGGVTLVAMDGGTLVSGLLVVVCDSGVTVVEPSFLHLTQVQSVPFHFRTYLLRSCASSQ